MEETVISERKAIAEFEDKIKGAEAERLEVEKLLMDERGKGGDYGLQLQKLSAQRDDMESQLRVRLNLNSILHNYHLGHGIFLVSFLTFALVLFFRTPKNDL